MKNRSKVYIKSFDLFNKSFYENIAQIGKALESVDRLKIMDLVSRKQYTLSQLSKELDLTPSSVAFHLKILLDAGLIETEPIPNKKTVRYTYTRSPSLIINLRKVTEYQDETEPYMVSIPIGQYSDIELDEECGITSEKSLITINKNDLFLKERQDAQLIWSSKACFIEYSTSNIYAFKNKVQSISFTFEICSEAYGYNSDYPSDITLSINGIELCVYRSKGDYGDRYGRYTPSWWFIESTKYGALVNLLVNDRGVFLNEDLVNDKIKLSDLKLSQGNKTTLRMEVKKDAVNCGGLNLFGDKFGDYAQNIELLIKY